MFTRKFVSFQLRISLKRTNKVKDKSNRNPNAKKDRNYFELMQRIDTIKHIRK